MNLKNKITLTRFALLLFLLGSVGANSARAADDTPEQAAKTFYVWYLKELNREGGNPIDNRQTLAKYVSRRLIKQIDAWRKAEEYDADYFIDAQDWDEKWQVATTKAAITGNRATLKVTLAAPKAKAGDWKQTLTIKLIKEGGAWKIDKVNGINYGT